MATYTLETKEVSKTDEFGNEVTLKEQVVKKRKKTTPLPFVIKLQNPKTSWAARLTGPELRVATALEGFLRFPTAQEKALLEELASQYIDLSPCKVHLLCELLGIHRRSVTRAIKGLIDKKCLALTDDGVYMLSPSFAYLGKTVDLGITISAFNRAADCDQEWEL